MQPVVIVGAGMAAYALARTLRQRDAFMPILLVTRDTGTVYTKPLLSNGFAQARDPAAMIVACATESARSLGIDVRVETHVRRIDPAAHAIDVDGGRIAYSSLVLATGAMPVPLALPGTGGADVMAVNHLDDYIALRERLAAAGPQARVVIIGAGLVGCEFADDLVSGGFTVTLVDRQARPLANMAPPGLSDALACALRQRGLAMHTQAVCTRVDRIGTGLLVTLDTGACLEADVVLAAVGIRPAIDLAQVSGLATARGIVVDTCGRTTAPDVYALGDCAEYVGRHGLVTLPYIAPMLVAARALAAKLTGTPTAIDVAPQPVIVKTPSCAMALMPPAAGITGRWHYERSAERLVARFADDAGVLRGWGMTSPTAALRQALQAALGQRAHA